MNCEYCNHHPSKFIWKAKHCCRACEDLHTKLKSAERRAFEKGLPFELTLKDLLLKNKEQGYKCYYTGIDFILFDKYYNVSIDRIDSTKGYTLQNINLVCILVNKMKSNLPESLFLSLITKMYLQNLKYI